MSVVRLVAPWRWRPVWQGLLLAIVSVAMSVHGMVVSTRERTAQTALSGMLEGLDLLAIEREVSVTTHDALAAVVMDMYEGGHDADVVLRLEALRHEVGQASVDLAARPPSVGWGVMHEGMTDAADRLLASFDQPRSRHEILAWLDEFLYDFKRVVPTDPIGTTRLKS